MEFLHSKFDATDDNLFLKSIADVLAKGNRIDLAVAYWGIGAARELGLDGSKPTRILCDLMSPGCNPHEIECFLRPPFTDKAGFEVRHLGGLHAKVYLTPDIAVVGSANASMNGLGTEGTTGKIEAAIKTSSTEVLTAAQTWFDRLWQQGKPVDAVMIAESSAVPRPAASTAPATFVDLLLDSRSLLRKRLTLVHISEAASSTSIRAFKKQATSYYTKAQIENLADDELPFYQAGRPKAEIDRECQPGDYIFNCANQVLSRIREPGTIEVSAHDCIVLLDDNRKYLLVYDDSRSEIIKRISLTNNDKQIMKRATRRLLALRGDLFQEGHYAEDMPEEFFQILREEAGRGKTARRM